jgi:hypothetical protein
MGCNNFAPGTKPYRGLSFHRDARLLPLLAPELFFELDAEDLGLHLIDGFDLLRRHRSQQPRNAVDGAVRVIGGECLLMRPLVSDVTEFKCNASIRRAKDLSEAVIPQVAHHL